MFRKQISTSSSQPYILQERWLRVIIEALSCCENIALSLVTKDPSETIGLKQSIGFLASSHQNPFIEHCRTFEGFKDYERAQIDASISLLEGRPGQTQLSTPFEPLAGKYISAIIPTSIPNVFIYCGPVALSSNGNSRQFSSDTNRQAILDAFSIFVTKASDQQAANFLDNYSLSRADRLISQRSPISSHDLENRLDNAKFTFEAILNSQIKVTPLSADSIETFTKSVAFCLRNLQEIPPSGGLPICPSGVQSNFFALGSMCPAIRRLDQNIFEVFEISSDLHARKNWTSELDIKWSKFCDDFKTNRNSSHLERLLMLRLWTQDTFTGTTIKTEDGLDHSNEFCELAGQILELIASDGCVIYKFHAGETTKKNQAARQGYLTPIGHHFAYPHLEKYYKDEFEYMQLIADDAEKRSLSACYRAVDSGKTEFLANVNSSKIATASPERTPNSVLVTPLISRGRVWGAIEILGKLPNQLPLHAPRWCEEVVRVITPIFYNQWMLFHFREMNRIAVSTSKSTEKYLQVVEHVKKIFLASSTRLYIQDMSSTSDFLCSAHAGVAFPPGHGTTFSLEDDESESAKCILREDDWSRGTIGVPPFDENESTSQTGSLENDGHRAAAIIPIRYADGDCFASLFITSLDDEDFPDEWMTIVKSVSYQLSVILETIHLKDIEADIEQAFLAHSIKTRSERVKSGGERLLRHLDPLFGDAEIYRRMPELIALAEPSLMNNPTLNHQKKREFSELWTALKVAFPQDHFERSRLENSIPKAVADLRKNLELIRISAVSIAGGPNDESPDDASPDTWSGPPCVLREAIFESLVPLDREPSSKGGVSLPPLGVLDSSVRVDIPEQILVEILNNMFDNAFKYDFSPPSVKLEVRTGDGGKNYVLEIKNLAPKIPLSDVAELKDGRKRGHYAFARDRTGTGKGLQYSIRKATQWGLTLEYDFPSAENLEQSDILGWHSLKLKLKNAGSIV